MAIDHLDDKGYCSPVVRPSAYEPGSRMRQSRRVNTGNRRDTTARRWRPWLWPDTPPEDFDERALSPAVPAPSDERSPVAEDQTPPATAWAITGARGIAEAVGLWARAALRAAPKPASRSRADRTGLRATTGFAPRAPRPPYASAVDQRGADIQRPPNWSL